MALAVLSGRISGWQSWREAGLVFGRVREPASLAGRLRARLELTSGDGTLSIFCVRHGHKSKQGAQEVPERCQIEVPGRRGLTRRMHVVLPKYKQTKRALNERRISQICGFRLPGN